LAIAGAGGENEQVIFSAPPFRQGGLGVIGKLVLGFLILIGLFTLALYGIGIVFFIIAYIGYRRSHAGIKGVLYVLTNKRAMVVSDKKNDKTVFQECNLADVVAVSQMKRNVKDSRDAYQTVAAVVGDVMFMQGTTTKVTFASVQDPDGVVKTVEEIKKSLYAG
jgi:hypothetical protein